MNTQLRNQHIFLWLIIAIILPTGLLISTEIPSSYLSNFDNSKATSDVNYYVEGNHLTFQVFHPFKAPTVFLYAIEKNNKEHFLGDVTAKGNFHFKIPSNTISLKVFDQHNKISLIQLSLKR
ncbi:hypothetical protein [Flammeovirga agarivorans]|uniref:Uncharacterized protein n=1 Tax=Flammeovirga agarivorans TaxID=2726742 RepID=A0A7X8SIV0_9BACT|nr:hypothetical protein [Flammeovirga agarivorans]NLR91011.1 hypothetical protein [Flammeovirga agarivorans]